MYVLCCVVCAYISVLLGDIGEADNQFYEDIAYDEDRDTWLLLKEANLVDGRIIPAIVEATIHDDTLTITQPFCPIDFDLDAENKGFEGISLVKRGGKEGQ